MREDSPSSLVRRATVEDRATVSRALAVSLLENTFVGHLTSRAKDHVAALDDYFKVCFDVCATRLVYRDSLGAALWETPDQAGRFVDTLRLGLVLLKHDWRRMPLAHRATLAKDAARPKAPHYYLSVLGVLPGHQSKGVGAALLLPTLEESDRKRIGAHLETANVRNIPFYERLGFRVQEKVEVSGAALPFFTMWREPKS